MEEIYAFPCYHSRSSDSREGVHFLTKDIGTLCAMIEINFDISFRREKNIFGEESSKEDFHFYIR